MVADQANMMIWKCSVFFQPLRVPSGANQGEHGADLESEAECLSRQRPARSGN